MAMIARWRVKLVGRVESLLVTDAEGRWIVKLSSGSVVKVLI